ncbi:helix-turn-helix domain-containing protein, partial [Streptomyces sp. 24-1644]|uniref:helix-turn-helix domain-containing protein n=1 Tax=Streptomyces sp. 24-1644 TaxID=3457315 RepID=UPI003FA78761
MAEGHSVLEVSRRLDVAAATVRTWRRRFIDRGLDDLPDEIAAGRPAEDHRRGCGAGHRQDAGGAAEARHPLVDQVDGGRHGHVTVRHLPDLADVRLAPRRSQTFKVSTDPYFIDKVRDIVRLYLRPPERALVLCV